MESTLLMSMGAIISFIIFFTFQPYTYIDALDADYKISANWEFETKHCGYAVVFGVLSACIAMMTLLTIGITKQIFYRLEERLKAKKLPAKLITCTIGGICIGL